MADPFKPVGPSTDDEPAPVVRKILWFLVLGLAGVVFVAAAAYILRAALFIG